MPDSQNTPINKADQDVEPTEERIFERDRFTGRTLDPWAHDGVPTTESSEDVKVRSSYRRYGALTEESENSLEPDLSRS